MLIDFSPFPLSSECDEHHEFTCDDGSCIPSADKCNNLEDCPNGEDEHNCGKRKHFDASWAISIKYLEGKFSVSFQDLWVSSLHLLYSISKPQNFLLFLNFIFSAPPRICIHKISPVNLDNGNCRWGGRRLWRFPLRRWFLHKLWSPLQSAKRLPRRRRWARLRRR